MATASIISNGATEASSSDFTLAAGESTTISIRGDAGDLGMAFIQCKQSDASYTDFGVLDRLHPVLVLAAIGTFKVKRAAGSTSFGVDRA